MPAFRALIVLLVSLVTVTTVRSQPAVEVPVESVALFSSGVGYFEHAGRIEGDRVATLHFTEEQINDVLQSLVALDHDGGSVRTMVYPADAPLDRALRSFEVNLSGTPSLGALLEQVRGRRVVVQHGRRTLRGPLVAVSREPDGSEGGHRWWLTVLDDGAMHRVALDDVQSVRLADEALQDELEGALSALARGRDRTRKPVSVRFEGQGTRRVQIGYVVETPVWKTTYRLLLPDENDPGFLQGWAIVENQTETDWDDVEVHLVSGRPVSFITPLYEPLYLDRPTVPLPTHAAVQPRRYQEGAEPAQEAARTDLDASLDLNERVVSAPSPSAPTAVRRDVMRGSTQPVGEAGEVGEAFEYRLGRVTLPRQQSALVPIVMQDVAVERLSIYDARQDRTHPRLGARVTNTTGRFLSAGPLTLFDDGTYTGDAMLPDLPPGDDRLVSYAVDLKVAVQREVPAEDVLVEAARIDAGWLHVEQRLHRAHSFTMENEDDDPRRLLLVVPRRDGWKLIDTPQPVEQTEGAWRFLVEVPPTGTTTFEVQSARTHSEEIVLTSQSADYLLRYRDRRGIPPDVRAALARAAEMHRAVEQTQRRVQEARARLEQLTRREQERIRENMQAVDENSAYYKRLLRKLEEQEDEIERLQDRLDELLEEENERRRALTDYLNDLHIP